MDIVRTIVVLSLGLLPQIGSKPALPTIERHRVGVVELGMTEQKLIETFPPERRELVDLQLEGMPAPAYLLRFEGATKRDGVVAELTGDPGVRTVSRIDVRDAAFRTSEGLGVGSTVGQLRAVYHLNSMVSGEGTVAIVVDSLSASFSLDQSGAGGGDLWKLKNTALVPDSVKINGILLLR